MIQKTEGGRDYVEVHNRLDKVVLVVAQAEAARAQTGLTASAARDVARLLIHAAETAEQTPKT
ncbi:MAG: hypothetical protein ACRDJX_07425 [Solirubrobacteraceae bacterium]